MDPVTGAIVSNVAGELLGGLFGSSSAKKQNKAAIAAQEAANAFTEKQLQNRHQWEVDDLRKAGLNPILSAHAAPSIGGSSAAPVVGETEHFANSAKNIGKAPLERQIAMANLRNINAQTENQISQASAARASANYQNTTAALDAQFRPWESGQKIGSGALNSAGALAKGTWNFAKSASGLLPKKSVSGKAGTIFKSIKGVKK